MDNRGKGGQAGCQKEVIQHTVNLGVLYYQPCTRIISKMDRAIDDLVAKTSSNSTAGHTWEDMVNRVLQRFVTIQASIFS